MSKKIIPYDDDISIIPLDNINILSYQNYDNNEKSHVLLSDKSSQSNKSSQPLHLPLPLPSLPSKLTTIIYGIWISLIFIAPIIFLICLFLYTPTTTPTPTPTPTPFTPTTFIPTSVF